MESDSETNKKKKQIKLNYYLPIINNNSINVCLDKNIMYRNIYHLINKNETNKQIVKIINSKLSSKTDKPKHIKNVFQNINKIYSKNSSFVSKNWKLLSNLYIEEINRQKNILLRDKDMEEKYRQIEKIYNKTIEKNKQKEIQYSNDLSGEKTLEEKYCEMIIQYTNEINELKLKLENKILKENYYISEIRRLKEQENTIDKINKEIKTPKFLKDFKYNNKNNDSINKKKKKFSIDISNTNNNFDDNRYKNDNSNKKKIILNNNLLYINNNFNNNNTEKDGVDDFDNLEEINL